MSHVDRRLLRWAHRHPVRENVPDAVARVVWAVQGVGRRLPGMTCLVQALAANAMLARRGVPARVRIGVRRSATPTAPLDAHAWLESAAGRVLIGDVPELADYQPLESATTRLTRQLAALLRGERVPWAAIEIDPDALLAFCEDEDLSGLVHRAIARGPAGDWPAGVRRSTRPPCAIGRRARNGSRPRDPARARCARGGRRSGGALQGHGPRLLEIRASGAAPSRRHRSPDPA